MTYTHSRFGIVLLWAEPAMAVGFRLVDLGSADINGVIVEVRN